MAAPRTLQQLIFVLAIIAAACSSEPQAGPEQTLPPSTASTTQPPSTTSMTSTAPDSTKAPPTNTATTSTSPPTSARPEPEFIQLPDGCFAGPAWRDGYENMLVTNRIDLPDAEWNPTFDLNGDGQTDRVVSHANTSVQAFLGEASGWTSFLRDFPVVPYSLAGRADLDRDGADELLLVHEGNNFSGIVVARVVGCDLMLLSSPDRDEAFFRLACGSSSCAGEDTRVDCIRDASGDRIRTHFISIVPDHLDDWLAGVDENPEQTYTVTESRLVGRLLVPTTLSVESRFLADPIPPRFEQNHFAEVCNPTS